MSAAQQRGCCQLPCGITPGEEGNHDVDGLVIEVGPWAKGDERTGVDCSFAAVEMKTIRDSELSHFRAPVYSTPWLSRSIILLLLISPSRWPHAERVGQRTGGGRVGNGTIPCSRI